MKTILMIVFNTFEHDARVERAATALMSAGYRVVVYCNYARHLPIEERRGGIDIRRGPLSQEDGAPPAEGRLRAVIRNCRRQIVRTLRRFVELPDPTLARRALIRLCRPYLERREFRQRRIEYARLARGAHACARGILPDIIHAHDFKELLAAESISTELAIPYVYDSHELWSGRNRGNHYAGAREKAWEMNAEARAIRSAAFTITVCQSIADHLAREYDVLPPIVVRNTPARNSGTPLASTLTRSELGLGTSDFVLIYVGRATSGRGIGDILEAMALTSERVKLVLLGYFAPSFEAPFYRKVARLGLAHRIIIRNPVAHDEVVAQISDCDLSMVTMNAVCLSYRYALPNKLFESVQALLPVIGTDLPEIRSVIDTYQCGECYADGDYQELARIINRLSNDPAALERYRVGASQARTALCWENEQHQLLDAYAVNFGQ